MENYDEKMKKIFSDVDSIKTQLEEIKNSKTPEVKTPEVKTPEVKTPEVKTPEVKTPEVKTSGDKTKSDEIADLKNVVNDLKKQIKSQYESSYNEKQNIQHQKNLDDLSEVL